MCIPLYSFGYPIDEQMLPEGSYTLSYLAPSSSLLFYPRSQTISVIAGQCQSPLPVIHTREGRVVSGQIVPPLQGVTIRMSVNENGVQSVLETTSDEKGWYAFTAIDHAAQFISFFGNQIVESFIHTLLKQLRKDMYSIPHQMV